MKLLNLRIQEIQYGPDAGKYTGKAEFSGEAGAVILNLNDQHIEEMFRVCADSIIEVSKAAARHLTASVIEHQKTIGKGDAS